MEYYIATDGVRRVMTAEEIEAYRRSLPPLNPLSQRQLRLLLLDLLGSDYEAQVLAAIAAIPDVKQSASAEIGWRYASQFEPDNSLVLTIRDALGMTLEDFEANWRTAQTL